MRNLLFIMIILNVTIISGCAHTSRFDRYLESAEQGDEVYQFKVGASYWRGVGVPQNYSESFKWFKKSAEQGNTTAQLNIAVMYDEGLGVVQNYKEAAKWYRESIDSRDWTEQDFGFGKYLLGRLYFLGRGVHQDYDEALEWYMKSSEKGFRDAQFALGQMYYLGMSVPQDYSKAMDFFVKASKKTRRKIRYYQFAPNSRFFIGLNEVISGSKKSRAEFIIGLMYYMGHGVGKDDDEAREWWEKSVLLGDENAYAYLKLMRNSDEDGPLIVNGDVESQYDLAEIFYKGDGVKQNYKEAIRWYKKSAEQGFSKSQYTLGRMYYLGQEVDQDYLKAIEWFKKSAKQGHAESQLSLASMYYFGEGILQNYKESIVWFKKLVGRGYPEAEYNLGLMYYQGKGVSIDYSESIRLWNMSADQRYFDALYALGMLHESGGGGFKRNLVLAYMYLSLAIESETKASNKLSNLLELRRVISEKMTNPQLEKAQDLAMDWVQKHQ